MASKAEKLRAKKAAKAQAQQPDKPQAPFMRPAVAAHPKVEAVRPTPEREAKGRFRMPSGRGKQRLPAIDEHHDTIAKLHNAKLLSDSQEAAARDWQALKAEVRAELGVRGSRSCLDISPAGHDSDDGNPEVMRRWRRIEAELGAWKTGALDYTCVLGNPPTVKTLPLLRGALDLFGKIG